MDEEIVFLLNVLKKHCPETGSELEQYFQTAFLCRPVSAFLIVYHLQDCLIHKAAMDHDSSLTLAEREEYWIRTGGPEKFFEENSYASLEVFKKDIFLAWNGFQALLFALHAEHSAFTLGYTPTLSQLINMEWEKWGGRLRNRFRPVLVLAGGG